MKNQLAVLPILILLICPPFCLGQTTKEPVDLREMLASSAKKADKDFPDDRDVLLTLFSYPVTLTIEPMNRLNSGSGFGVIIMVEM